MQWVKRIWTTFVVTLFGLFPLAIPSSVFADDIEFTVRPDRTQITAEESVSVKFSLRSDRSINISAPPKFNAPDFQLVNEYTGTHIESFYENGRFGVRNNQQITKVLRPLKTGVLTISELELQVDGKVYKAASININVVAAGAGTPPPRNYGGAGMGLRGAGKRPKGSAFFVRAEVDKHKVYKGEQIVVSYYLYQKLRTFNIMVEKYPILSGFLREDLEMPVLGQRLDTERVILDGVAYTRALLTRYAAYPLKEGSLSIDSLSVKANYYSNQGVDDGEDPFATFFQQLAPRVGTSRSEILKIESLPLPEENRPQSFSGGVGDFSVASAIDKYEVRANEAVTLTVKIEGHGNVAAIQEPKGKWPANIELYESKGRAKSGQGGVGEKVFEFLLIPRTTGKVDLPPLEISFFDPIKASYVTKNTQPITLSVSEPLPGSAAIQNPRVAATGSENRLDKNAKDDLRYIKAPGETTVGFKGHPWWRWMYWLSAAGFLFFVSFVLLETVKSKIAHAEATKEERILAQSKSWQKLRTAAKAATAGASWKDVVQTYELLSGALYDAIDEACGVGARSASRTDLKALLVEEHKVAETTWNRFDKLFDFAEMVRFATSAGAVSEKTAREQLSKWVTEGQSLSNILLRQKKKNKK